MTFILPKIQDEKYEIIAAILSATGLYSILSVFLNYLFNRVKLLKRILLGDKYLEGTWVGVFEGKSGQKRYLVEIFKQSLERLQITGESFDENGNVLGRWNSETTSIDNIKAVLIYSYQCDLLARKESYHGMAKFNIHQEEKSKVPNVLRGYSTDLIDGKRQNAFESKLSNNELDVTNAFERAKKLPLH